jgi:hypothetical protein
MGNYPIHIVINHNDLHLQNLSIHYIEDSKEV